MKTDFMFLTYAPNQMVNAKKLINDLNYRNSMRQKMCFDNDDNELLSNALVITSQKKLRIVSKYLTSAKGNSVIELKQENSFESVIITHTQTIKLGSEKRVKADFYAPNTISEFETIYFSSMSEAILHCVKAGYTEKNEGFNGRIINTKEHIKKLNSNIKWFSSIVKKTYLNPSNEKQPLL